MADIYVVVAMSNGEKHSVKLTGAEFERAIRTTGIVKMPLAEDAVVWLNPAHIVSAMERDADRPSAHTLGAVD